MEGAGRQRGRKCDKRDGKKIEKESNTKRLAVGIYRSCKGVKKTKKKQRKTRVTDKAPNNLCQDFYTFLCSGSDSHSRLQFPIEL